MQLTTYTDYCLRVLIYLGLNPDRRATIGEIAAAYGISQNHLMKVVHRLTRGGYIDSRRGKNGGLKLARPAAEIGIGRLIRDSEPDFALVECMNAGNACLITPACTLQSMLRQAVNAFHGELDRYTLQDILGSENKLKRLLARQATSSRSTGKAR